MSTTFHGRPRLLLIAPITPADRGSGLAMRAGLFLDALSQSCDVTVLVAPGAGPALAEWPAFVLDRSVDWRCLQPAPATQTSPALRPPGGALHDVAALERHLLPVLARFAADGVEEARRIFSRDPPFDLVLTMRLYLAPLVAAFRRPGLSRPRTMLDMDDDEVTTRRRIAALHEQLGQQELSDGEVAESEKYRILEERQLRAFDKVFVCSVGDREVVGTRTGHCGIHVVPNGVRIPAGDTVTSSTSDGRFHLLFVGNLNYFPNIDAAALLCHRILPELRARVDREVCVDLVGSRPASNVRDLGVIAGVTIYADVHEVTPHYQRAHLAVVPIRAGGGTRLKILEAFAHDVPVVSTSIGAEGLDVIPERHLLIGDDPSKIVDACYRLLTQPDVADRLRSQARSFVAAHYDASEIGRRLRALVHQAISQ